HRDCPRHRGRRRPGRGGASGRRERRRRPPGRRAHPGRPAARRPRARAPPPRRANYVQAVATATQTPPDLAGMMVLSVLAAAAGGLAEVAVRPDWREPPNLFAAVGMSPEIG